MSQTSLHSFDSEPKDKANMQRAQDSWAETVEDMSVSTNILVATNSKSQIDFNSPKLSKFGKIDDSAHFLNSSVSETDINAELAAISSPILPLANISQLNSNVILSPSVESVNSTAQKKRKLAASPTITRSTDTFVSVESSIFDHTFVNTCGPQAPGLRDVYDVSINTFELVTKLHF